MLWKNIIKKQNAYLKDTRKGVFFISSFSDFIGDVIEPSYEFFTAVVNIYLDGECIFGEGSRCAGSYRKERTSFGKFENLDVAVRFLETELDGIEVEYKL